MNKYHAAKAISSFGNILEINGTDINIYFAIIGFPVTLGLNYYTKYQGYGRFRTFIKIK